MCMTSFFNSSNPCPERFDSLFTAISCPSFKIPWNVLQPNVHSCKPDILLEWYSISYEHLPFSLHNLHPAPPPSPQNRGKIHYFLSNNLLVRNFIFFSSIWLDLVIHVFSFMLKRGGREKRNFFLSLQFWRVLMLCSC